MQALHATANQTLTENMAPTLESTLSPTLDAFRALDGFQKDNLAEVLSKSWAEDAPLTLRLIWQLRSVPDGKGEKEAFYRQWLIFSFSAFGWLYDNHPRTAISNLHLLYEPVCFNDKIKNDTGRAHGYWKDLLNILALATVDELGSDESTFLHREHNKESQRQAREARAARGLERYETLASKLKEPKYRALYIAVARLFAARLCMDISLLTQSESIPTEAGRLSHLRQLSLVGKWAPSAGGSHDRFTNITTAISYLMYNSRASLPIMFPSSLESSTVHPFEKASILRSFFQRWVLTPLRTASEIPETYMSANRWDEIKYTRVPSVCMKNNSERFFKHDPEGFQDYMIEVESGKKTISGATLMPNEILHQIVAHSADRGASEKYPKLAEFKKTIAENKVRVAEAQWNTLISRLRESGSIDNAIALCDVSGSMGSFQHSDAKDPILPALALSLVLSKLSKAPFNDGFITFSRRPEFIRLDPTKSLYDTVAGMVETNWEMNTNFNAVFMDLLLPLAIKHNIKQEDMIKRFFVFSDMQFDEADGQSSDPAAWETNYDMIEKAYKAAGYEVPQLVFWDLSRYGTTQVMAERKGIALMNGFSPALMKVFMGECEEGELEGWEKVAEGNEKVKKEDEFNPLNVMKKSVMKKSFDGLVVVD
ncbi:uncharacterized protein BT62DRAFT_879605 [Guyanagaster necrorhizus]|uniref:DUF2828 domain-containing protein n=1 Tax=Guyanagaster necrorhizus TaxID=856835 RepID=A0A9P7W4K7_9AGAR|nr:uncharacterized protein BT62DRAFT_879605 [Guyanagaster necrorhizus MCA 3950]KAG7452469.1 hypothetical protein BT62DRAFT_879605 [Guyanagaster necrorhizus MCA 3950]